MVLNGDVPLLTSETLAGLADTPTGQAAMLTAVLDDATGYGRVLRSPDDGNVTAIVEHRDATDAQREVREVNAGMYALDRDGLDDLRAVQVLGSLLAAGLAAARLRLRGRLAHGLLGDHDEKDELGN